MGDPVASGSLAESTPGSAASIHSKPPAATSRASVDTSSGRTTRTLCRPSPSPPSSSGTTSPTAKSTEATPAIAGVARFVPSRSDVGVAAGGCFAARMTVRCACKSPRIGLPASTSAAPATAATRSAARSPTTPGWPARRPVPQLAMSETGGRRGSRPAFVLARICIDSGTRGQRLSRDQSRRNVARPAESVSDASDPSSRTPA